MASLSLANENMESMVRSKNWKRSATSTSKLHNKLSDVIGYYRTTVGTVYTIWTCGSEQNKVELGRCSSVFASDITSRFTVRFGCTCPTGV